ncbi:hypothetical protein [Sinorhizobium saheli]|uniref:hypothetical protein n=1 Tax=Sinorhizobium saheli TaxID=36856 RepID=UPI000A72ACBB|nr:hypothetical protein [Sinorhizobium saheli]
MTTETVRDGEDPLEKRRHIDAMKDAFASAIEARQAELRARELPGQRTGWKPLLFRKSN